MADNEEDVIAHGAEGNIFRPLAGGAATMIATLLGTLAIGGLSDWEARVLVETSLSGMRSFCNTSILASGTILALMLTAIGLSRQTSSVMKTQHYEHIRRIARIDTILLVGTTVILLLLNFPITESEGVPTDWYGTLYYVIIVCTSLIGGTLVAVVLMLYDAIGNIIDVVEHGQMEKEIVASEKSLREVASGTPSVDDPDSGAE